MEIGITAFESRWFRGRQINIATLWLSILFVFVFGTSLRCVTGDGTNWVIQNSIKPFYLSSMWLLLDRWNGEMVLRMRCHIICKVSSVIAIFHDEYFANKLFYIRMESALFPQEQTCWKSDISTLGIGNGSLR